MCRRMILRFVVRDCLHSRAGTCHSVALSRQTRPKSSSSVPGAFRRNAVVEGVTIVADDQSARRALEELRRLKHRPHAWDTETADIGLQRSASHSPVTHGRVVCASCYCGDDADFGNGPRLFIDNDGPAAGLLRQHFQEYFEDRDYKKVFHNYSFDAHMLRRTGITLHGFHADTLHLARLYDTSLASWEGQLAKKQLSGQAAFASSRAAPPSSPAPTGRVVGVSLGGKPLEAALPRGSRASSGVGAMLPTGPAELPTEETEPAPSIARPGPPVPNGYGLKQLSAYWGLSDGVHQSFGQLFGQCADSAQNAHDSADEFVRWVQYTTLDAVLTFRLFEFLQGKLKARPWCTQVHMRPLHELLRDKEIARKLYRDRNCPDQFSTGKSMWDFFELYIREFAESLVNLERVGIGVDVAALQRMEVAAQEDVKACDDAFRSCLSTLTRGSYQTSGQAAARDANGAPFNPSTQMLNTRSSQQLQTLLFGGVGVNRFSQEPLPEQRSFFKPPNKEADASCTADKHVAKERRFTVKSIGLEPSTKRAHYTKAGWPSVSSAALRELVGSSDTPSQTYAKMLANGFTEEDAERVMDGLKQLRSANRIKSVLAGFLQPLQRHGETTGRIHPSWAFDTSTGRLACRRPNLQNLPLPSEDQKQYKLRDAFCAGPGKSFVVADYSQLELRVLAHMADAKQMIDTLSKGGDYHSEVAAEMFDYVGRAVKSGEVVVNANDARGCPTVKSRFPRERSQAKAVNFGIVFGKEPMSLAEDLGISLHESEELYERWFQSKPEVKKWRERVVRESKQSGRMLSLLGRWRTLPFLEDENPWYRRRSERACVNYGIQGSAADIVLAAMLRIVRNQRLQELGFGLVLQVHDEFVLEGPEERAVEAGEVVRELMVDPFREHSQDFNLRLPLTVDVGIGPSLYTAQK